MKELYGRWRLDIGKLNALLTSACQPISFKVKDTTYNGIEFTDDKSKVTCYKNLWYSTDGTSIDADLEIKVDEHVDSGTVSIDYKFPILIKASTDADLRDFDNADSILTSSRYVSNITANLNKGEYLYVAIPELFIGEIPAIFTINGFNGGIELLKQLKLAVNNYVPVIYNIYRTNNKSLGTLNVNIA